MITHLRVLFVDAVPPTIAETETLRKNLREVILLEIESSVCPDTAQQKLHEDNHHVIVMGHQLPVFANPRTNAQGFGESRARISTLFLLMELRHMNSSIPVIPAMFHTVSKSWELAALAINYRALQPTEMRCDLDHIASAIVRAHKNNLILSRPKNLPSGKNPTGLRR